MNNGIIYYNKGNSCVLRLMVSIYSLRKYYNGPITVFLESCDIVNIKYFFENNCINTIYTNNIENNNVYIRKIEVSKLSPYMNTIFIDADTIVLDNIDKLFDNTTTHDLCVTKFADWSSNSKIISKRIQGFSKDIPLEDIKRAVVYGPAINTGVYSFNKNSIFFNEWLLLAKIGQSKNLYIPDEVACQILLPKYNIKILDPIYNVSVKFGKNDIKNKIIHYHGKKHCKDFALCEFWIQTFLELVDKYKYGCILKKFIGSDPSVNKFLNKKYGWENYIDTYLLKIKP